MSKNTKNQQIIQAAISLLGEQGTAVPTAKIAQEAGVSNGTLFNYYATKQDLLDAVYLTIKQEVSEHIINEDTQAIQGIQELINYIWHAYVMWAIDNPDRHQVVSLLRSSNIISEQAKATVDEIFSFINQRLEQAQQAGTIREISTELLCEIAAAQISATINHGISQSFTGESLEHLIKQSCELYWNGIKL